MGTSRWKWKELFEVIFVATGIIKVLWDIELSTVCHDVLKNRW